ncbi:hypothetical protein [Paenibacillus contaminans]|uniref:Methyltransferase n=1 Tax=Paenibacillus contaminans TaxID=450362 RepID=A0A329MLS8_9BACL|nr:hypothetical protein [Paenibacillus contaminans]RAV20562.1 hypothetical protein DQG23_13680 [Paenibacillus contaminans]
MSRSWERMVERNQKKVNKARVKSGRGSISSAGTEEMRKFKGRSYMLPLVLCSLGVFYMVAFGGVYEGDNTFWFTSIAYILLGAFVFLVRRPFLSIGKTKIVSRRFTGDKVLQAADIEEIVISPGYVVVQMKEKKRRWVFSKLMNLFDIAGMQAEVKQFAQKNNVPLKEEEK